VITPWTGVTKGRHIENTLENKAINEILKQICSANEACHIFRGAAGGKIDGIGEVLQWKVGLLSIPIYII